ncbi:reverse transcriptase domain-containing protein [Tanacetum coccineum]|uniref:Reverse transcriptase domain-containing protein n=1 Tax=Tanacetum coccineum TaxID=301880 RepID=A0ABQ5FWX2_9ASTR
MVKEGIILGHKVLGAGIEVDKAKIEAISKLPYPANVKPIRSFLGHAGFNRRFIKDFSQVARPMTHLLVKDAPFNSSEKCIQAFDKKELLAVVFAFDKFRQYLVLSKTIVFTDHSALRNVLTESYEGALSEMRQHKSFGNVTTNHLEVIMVSPSLQEKSLKLVSTGHVSSVTHAGWSKFVMHVNEPAISLQGAKHLKNTSKKAWENRFLRINKLNEMRLNAYESSISYKERTKRWHDKRIKAPTNYERGDKVLIFNSCLRLFPRKLKSRWYGSFSVSKDIKNGAIELYDEDGNEFIVNKEHVKPYQKTVLDANRDDDITLDDEGEFT